MHGGVVATVMDSAAAVALGRLRGEQLRRDNPHATVEMNVSLISAARPGDELIVEGRVLKLGRAVAFCEAEARRRSDSELIAKGRFTFAISTRKLRVSTRGSMATVYIGLGANIGNREANLRMALRGLTRMARVEAVSSLYETDPVGSVQDHPPSTTPSAASRPASSRNLSCASSRASNTRSAAAPAARRRPTPDRPRYPPLRGSRASRAQISQSPTRASLSAHSSSSRWPKSRRTRAIRRRDKTVAELARRWGRAASVRSSRPDGTVSPDQRKGCGSNGQRKDNQPDS